MRRLLLFLALLALPATAAAEDPLCADEGPTLDKYAYLRALSLDLRGVVPSYEEYQALDTVDDVPEATIDAWLASDAFLERSLKLHRDLLWLRVLRNNIVNTRARLTQTNANGGSVYYRRDRAQALRGAVIPCLDEPATFDANGVPEMTWDEEAEAWREGWVEVLPHWAPDDGVRVCALDSYERAESSDGDVCATFAGQNDPECGCGPGLQWCVMPGGENVIRRALERDVELRIETLIREDRPWTELFTGSTAYMNGPLSWWWREMAPHAQQLDLDPSPFLPGTIPDLSWADEDTWVPVELGAHHGGVLTSLPYLLRFASNRARANRFYERFLCRPFVPPAGGIPSSGDELVTLDLQERDGCKYCHALLEPAAAHWGRWPEAAGGYLDAEGFPPFRQDCYDCATTSATCSQECRDYYVVEALGAEEEPFLGQLRAYEFRDEAHEAGVEEGPGLLARAAVVDGRLPSCVATTVGDWLLGTRDADPEWYDELGRSFVSSEFSFRELVRTVVTSEPYRRVR